MGKKPEERIADALERIAAALERAAKPPVQTNDSGGTQEPPK